MLYHSQKDPFPTIRGSTGNSNMPVANDSGCIALKNFYGHV